MLARTHVPMGSDQLDAALTVVAVAGLGFLCASTPSMWLVVVLALITCLLAFVDVAYFIGLCRHSLCTRTAVLRSPRLESEDAAAVATRSSTMKLAVRMVDLDRNAHMNNARYARECGFGRMSHLTALGVWSVLLERGANVVIVAQTFRYRRELRFGQTYHLTTRIVGWTARSFLIEQRFVVDQFVHAIAYVEYQVVWRKAAASTGTPPTPAALLRAAVAATRGGDDNGSELRSPPLPPAIAAWRECNSCSSDALRAEAGLSARPRRTNSKKSNEEWSKATTTEATPAATAAAHAPSGDVANTTTAFIGLGAMGWHMARHLHAKGNDNTTYTFKRSSSRSLQRHADEFGTTVAPTLRTLVTARIVVLCLPTSAHVRKVAISLADDVLAPGAIVIDTTSGDPTISREIAALLSARGIRYCDAPVSGGPHGAEAGTLTSMLGSGDLDPADAARVRGIVERWSKTIRVVGGVGTGHAIKAVNNALNMTHLAVATEGLLALKALGVDPAVALGVINASSGRSLQTEVRLPEKVVTPNRSFDYGFKLTLMAKDVRIADAMLDDVFPAAALIRVTREITDAAAARLGDDADYTEVVKELEARIGGGVML